MRSPTNRVCKGDLPAVSWPPRGDWLRGKIALARQFAAIPQNMEQAIRPRKPNLYSVPPAPVSFIYTMNIAMFDTHCHLNFDVFENDLDVVITEARSAGVTRILVPGTDIKSSKKAVELSSKYPSVYAAVGIHPTVELNEEGMEASLKEIESLAESNDCVVAIGEVGLDYYKYKSAVRVQNIYFRKQAELAEKLGLSLVIHNRQSTQALLEILSDFWTGALEGSSVFHCAEPDMELLNFAKDKNVYLGIDGDITYDKTKQEFIKHIPLDLLVLETDSPFLSPKPVRSTGVKYNEPRYLRYVVSSVAKLLGESEDKIRKVTTQNALKLFNLL